MDDKVATQIFDRSFAASSPELEARGNQPAYLILLEGGLPGSMFRLLPGSNRMGRSGDNHIQILDSSLSRHHALVELNEEGGALLTDLGSTNGTYVNSCGVTSWQPRLLGEGDRLRMGGEVVLKYSRPDPCEERCHRELFERATGDPLTGLFNRAYFFDQIGKVAVAAARKGLGLATLMLDIDHFKEINDSYGHDAGDRALREVAGVFRQVLRSDDLVARYGGEEFVAALPIGSVDQAIERAERIGRAVAARSIVLPRRALRMTCSIGVAFRPPGETTQITDEVAAADHAMYVAKRSGRNRVVLADGSGAFMEPSRGA